MKVVSPSVTVRPWVRRRDRVSPRAISETDAPPRARQAASVPPMAPTPAMQMCEAVVMDRRTAGR
ncbi:hypothetical protein GLI01_17730 [Gluconacetobacter liquefaciens]|nr:hypothetical protein GLI01_17730 [Gluconacetobacter liquefaciens]